MKFYLFYSNSENLVLWARILTHMNAASLLCQIGFLRRSLSCVRTRRRPWAMAPIQNLNSDIFKELSAVGIRIKF